jgi:iron(III) transport system substrate-binding protein
MNKLLKLTLGAPLLLAASLAFGAANAENLTLYTSQPEADAAKTIEGFRKVNPV